MLLLTVTGRLCEKDRGCIERGLLGYRLNPTGQVRAAKTVVILREIEPLTAAMIMVELFGERREAVL